MRNMPKKKKILQGRQYDKQQTAIIILAGIRGACRFGNAFHQALARFGRVTVVGSAARDGVL